MLPTNAVKVGLYAYSIHEEITRETHHMAVDSNINAESIIARLQNDADFKGVKINTKDFELEAKNFTFKASSDEHDTGVKIKNAEIEVELDSSLDAKGASFDGASKTSQSYAKIHHANYIKASGTIKIKLSSNGKLKGVSLEGLNVIIDYQNLILESVQDELMRRISGINMHIDVSEQEKDDTAKTVA
jgi:hypothetical protein